MATDLEANPKNHFHCIGCGHEWVSKTRAAKCPECGGKKVHSHASCSEGSHSHKQKRG